MRLYFLRHGHAEVGGTIEDHDRQLTEEGRQFTAAAARLMARIKLKPHHIYSSPRARARQTAEIVSEALGIPVEIRDEVNYGFNIAAVEHLLEHEGMNAEIMFVGHEPSMSTVIGDLTGGLVAMKKAGLARVDLRQRTPPRGELVWLIPPRVFSALDDDES